MQLHNELLKRCENYPLRSQEHTRDPTVCAKLFFPISRATWFITEYNPVTQIAFGYVAGLAHDEWGYISIPELQGIKLANVFSVEVDLYFEATKASALGIIRP